MMNLIFLGILFIIPHKIDSCLYKIPTLVCIYILPIICIYYIFILHDTVLLQMKQNYGSAGNSVSIILKGWS